jgi:hypothetical protein
MTTGSWHKVGHIERIPGTLKSLRVVARAFGKETTGIITSEGVQRLLSPGSSPGEILGTRRGTAGAEITEKIGTAYRSRSGRGIIVSLVRAPAASGSWAGLKDVLAGTRERVNLSVLEEAPPFREPAPVKAEGSDIRAGLSSRF